MNSLNVNSASSTPAPKPPKPDDLAIANFAKELVANPEKMTTFRNQVRAKAISLFSGPDGPTRLRQVLGKGSLPLSIVTFIISGEVLDGLGIKSQAASLSLSLTAAYVANTALARACQKTFLKSLGNSANLTNFMQSVFFTYLAGTIYNGILDDFEVANNSMLRSKMAEGSVWIGSALLAETYMATTSTPTGLLGKILANTGKPTWGPAGAALPFALVAFANEMIPVFSSNATLRKMFQDQIMVELGQGAANGEADASYALFMFCVPILNNVPILAISQEDVKAKAVEVLAQANSTANDLKLSLQKLWLTTDFLSLGYFGDAKPIEFFTEIKLPTEKLANMLAKRISLSPAEEKAINFATNEGRKLTPSDLDRQLKKRFGIVDTSAFLQKVTVAKVQEVITSLLSSSAVTEAESLNNNPSNSSPIYKLRSLFKADGTLKAGFNEDLLHWALNGQEEKLIFSISQQRRYQRVLALFSGIGRGSGYRSPADIELGFVNSDKSINTRNPHYIRLAEIAAETVAKTIITDPT